MERLQLADASFPVQLFHRAPCSVDVADRLVQENGIQMESWGPFAEGKNNILHNTLLKSIADNHGRSIAQVVIRWLTQRGIVAIPKSVRKERMAENFDVFDFELSAGEMSSIATLDTGTSSFFDHRDPATVKWLSEAQRPTQAAMVERLAHTRRHMKRPIPFCLLLLLSMCAQRTMPPPANPHADHAAAPPTNWAKQALERSPRHGEWVNVKAGNRTVSAFVVYPEVKGKATSVVVIHEIFGMSDWVQMEADELAAAGYIAIAPDLLSGMGPKGGGTGDFADGNAVGKAIRDLPPDQITSDLNAVADYVAKLPAANGRVAVAGFCWGGGQAFRFATNRPSLAAAFVFYGTGPEPESIAKINAPVYGFYAGNDARVGATVPKTQELMKAAGKTYDVVTYEGAGHGFMRAGDAPPPSSDADEKTKEAYAGNRKARDTAWVRWKGVLEKL
ncbi:MAG: Dienelactone hydrolase-related enzyme [Acidobacteria bacterium]|nr:Dienelactone hydrolase-related enzyme [Acidobacteriota bacterium]